MRHLGTPAFRVEDLLDRMLGPRSKKIAALSPELQAVESAYEKSLASNAIWQFSTGVPGLTSNQLAEIRWAYKGKLRNVKSKHTREIYDKLRAAAKGKCPLCIVGQVFGLDHYLPQEFYPGLSINPTNLYPVCEQCNNTKSSTVATSADTQFLHPYFDDLGGYDWLQATVVEEPLAPVIFAVQAPASWSANLTKRVELHFDRFGLGALFANEAVDQLGSLQDILVRLHNDEPVSGVRDTLLEQASSYESYGARPHHVAAMRAWAQSDWFCSGGWLAGEDISDARPTAAIASRQA